MASSLSYSNSHSTAPPPPPLSVTANGGPPPQQGPSVMQILSMGQERNHAADQMAHHPRIESLIKLGKEAEATWLQIGRTAEAVGDADRAIAAYEAALRHNAYSIIALSQIAAICRSKEQFKKAAEYFGRALGIAPESGDIWGALGHCYLMIDDLKKAYSSYQQALFYMPNPQEPKLWYGIGILYDRYGSLEHAEDAFASVIKMDPNFEKANEIFFRLGIIYKQQRKSGQSLECFRYILNNPPHPLTEIDIWFQIGHVHEQQKDFLAAKESYERVLAENPSHAKVLQQLGGLYHRSRAPFYNPEVSVQILLKSLESDPNDPFSWYLLGRAYMTVNNFSKAYEAYQQAVYRDGKNPAFWCSIGVLYYNITQYHDALDAYSRAIRIHPYLAEVWFNLGALYESCNDQMTDAIDAYQRTLQLDPNNAVVSSRLREIRAHQESGAPLGSPPEPKDISPSSMSWNYATGSGGAPAQLAQAGLGPELSPSMNRSNGHGPGSPSNGRFDGPPPSTSVSNGAGPASSRPRSTDPYHRDERRRTSGHGAAGHQSPAHDHASPRSSNNHRHSGAPQVPQLKGMHDVRGSPTLASASDPHRRESPPSPRSRHEGRQNGPSDYPSSSATGGHYPNISSHPYGRPSDHESMDWERARGAPPTNGRHSAQGSHHYPSHPSQSHLGPPGPPSHMRGSPPITVGSSRDHPPYDRQAAHSPLSNRSDDRPPPPGYPTPYGYAPYPPSHPGSSGPVSSNVIDRRYAHGPGGPSPAQMEEDRRRGTAPLVPSPRSTSASASTAVDKRQAGSSTSAAPVVKRGAVVKEEFAAPTAGTSTPPAGKKEGGGGGRGRKSDVVAGAKKERRTSSNSKNSDGSTNGRGKKANSSAGSSNSSPAVKSPIITSAPGVSAPLVTSVPTAPTREIDEDYDEGVDALMGLSQSGNNSANNRSVPSSAAPASEKGQSTDDEVTTAAALLNPRKRPLELSDAEPAESAKKNKPASVAAADDEIDELASQAAVESPAPKTTEPEIEEDELATPPPGAGEEPAASTTSSLPPVVAEPESKKVEEEKKEDDLADVQKEAEKLDEPAAEPETVQPASAAPVEVTSTTAQDSGDISMDDASSVTASISAPALTPVAPSPAEAMATTSEEETKKADESIEKIEKKGEEVKGLAEKKKEAGEVEEGEVVG